MDCDKACLQLAALLGWDNELKQLTEGPLKNKEKPMNSPTINSITSKLNSKNANAMKKLTVEKKEQKATYLTQINKKDLSSNQLKVKLKARENLLSTYKSDLVKYRDHLAKGTVPAHLHAQKFPKPRYSLSLSTNENDWKQIIKNTQTDALKVEIKNLEDKCMQIEKEIGDMQNSSKL
jgi:hypothetical protein